MKHRMLGLSVALFGGLSLVLIVALSVSSATPTQPAATVRYVAPGGSCGGAAPCYESVQTAVDAANIGDEIRVATGTYTGVSSREGLTQIVYIDKTIALRGGYSPHNWTNSEPDRHPTTLDAQGKGRVIYVSDGTSPIIEGLRIIGGDATGLGGGYFGFDCGGGVLLRYVGSAATFHNNSVLSNAAYIGGGLCVHRGNPAITDNTFSFNTAWEGAGLWVYQTQVARLSGNVISSNAADQTGGGLILWGETAEFAWNTIISNTAVHNSGGGVVLEFTGSAFSNNLIRGNVANGGWWYSGGGGVWIVGGSPLLTNNVIIDNYALSGSALKIRQGTLVSRHDTFARNSGGSGVSVISDPDAGDSDATFTNAILVGHSVGISVTGGSAVTVNGILWDPSTPITVSQSSMATVAVQNQHTGDPAFTADGYHITGASAALDAGVNAGVATDFDGHHRPLSVAPDLGADEAIAAHVYPQSESILIYHDTQGSPTEILVPEGAVTKTVLTVFIPVDEVAAPVGFGFANHAFDLDAYQDRTLLEGYPLSSAATVTIHYTDRDVSGVDEDALILAYWNEAAGAWQDAACGAYERRPDENWLAVPICHLSRFTLFGTQYDVYVPIALRNR